MGRQERESGERSKERKRGKGGQERGGEGNHHRKELQGDNVMEANQECLKI